ncbi:eukaryotic translation initiation factor 4 gamma [Anaeramoeba flamelloides]|uniref:Eukaryotic translation initiation factor 4 gamma n=1 Tax=Anaeramoeba flamelloides TaxID=1746091 RepID=A0ABQ8YTK0_9EUKA|nr:eukaryotic translation initiation factor 4 gamma [Anaeramoeba flamelloides]
MYQKQIFELLEERLEKKIPTNPSKTEFLYLFCEYIEKIEPKPPINTQRKRKGKGKGKQKQKEKERKEKKEKQKQKEKERKEKKEKEKEKEKTKEMETQIEIQTKTEKETIKERKKQTNHNLSKYIILKPNPGNFPYLNIHKENSYQKKYKIFKPFNKKAAFLPKSIQLRFAKGNSLFELIIYDKNDSNNFKKGYFQLFYTHFEIGTANEKIISYKYKEVPSSRIRNSKKDHSLFMIAIDKKINSNGNNNNNFSTNTNTNANTNTNTNTNKNTNENENENENETILCRTKNVQERNILCKLFAMYKWYNKKQPENIPIKGSILGISEEIEAINLRCLSNNQSKFKLNIFNFKTQKTENCVLLIELDKFSITIKKNSTKDSRDKNYLMCTFFWDEINLNFAISISNQSLFELWVEKSKGGSFYLQFFSDNPNLIIMICENLHLFQSNSLKIFTIKKQKMNYKKTKENVISITTNSEKSQILKRQLIQTPQKTQTSAQFQKNDQLQKQTEKKASTSKKKQQKQKLKSIIFKSLNSQNHILDNHINIAVNQSSNGTNQDKNKYNNNFDNNERNIKKQKQNQKQKQNKNTKKFFFFQQFKITEFNQFGQGLISQSVSNQTLFSNSSISPIVAPRGGHVQLKTKLISQLKKISKEKKISWNIEIIKEKAKKGKLVLIENGVIIKSFFKSSSKKHQMILNEQFSFNQKLFVHSKNSKRILFISKKKYRFVIDCDSIYNRDLLGNTFFLFRDRYLISTIFTSLTELLYFISPEQNQNVNTNSNDSDHYQKQTNNHHHHHHHHHNSHNNNHRHSRNNKFNNNNDEFLVINNNSIYFHPFSQHILTKTHKILKYNIKIYDSVEEVIGKATIIMTKKYFIIKFGRKIIISRHYSPFSKLFIFKNSLFCCLQVDELQSINISFSEKTDLLNFQQQFKAYRENVIQNITQPNCCYDIIIITVTSGAFKGYISLYCDCFIFYTVIGNIRCDYLPGTTLISISKQRLELIRIRLGNGYGSIRMEFLNENDSLDFRKSFEKYKHQKLSCSFGLYLSNTFNVIDKVTQQPIKLFFNSNKLFILRKIFEDKYIFNSFLIQNTQIFKSRSNNKLLIFELKNLQKKLRFNNNNNDGDGDKNDKNKNKNSKNNNNKNKNNRIKLLFQSNKKLLNFYHSFQNNSNQLSIIAENDGLLNNSLQKSNPQNNNNNNNNSNSNNSNTNTTTTNNNNNNNNNNNFKNNFNKNPNLLSNQDNNKNKRQEKTNRYNSYQKTIKNKYGKIISCYRINCYDIIKLKNLNQYGMIKLFEKGLIFNIYKNNSINNYLKYIKIQFCTLNMNLLKIKFIINKFTNKKKTIVKEFLIKFNHSKHKYHFIFQFFLQKSINLPFLRLNNPNNNENFLLYKIFPIFISKIKIAKTNQNYYKNLSSKKKKSTNNYKFTKFLSKINQKNNSNKSIKGIIKFLPTKIRIRINSKINDFKYQDIKIDNIKQSCFVKFENFRYFSIVLCFCDKNFAKDFERMFCYLKNQILRNPKYLIHKNNKESGKGDYNINSFTKMYSFNIQLLESNHNSDDNNLHNNQILQISLHPIQIIIKDLKNEKMNILSNFDDLNLKNYNLSDIAKITERVNIGKNIFKLKHPQIGKLLIKTENVQQHEELYKLLEKIQQKSREKIDLIVFKRHEETLIYNKTQQRIHQFSVLKQKKYNSSQLNFSIKNPGFNTFNIHNNLSNKSHNSKDHHNTGHHGENLHNNEIQKINKNNNLNNGSSNNYYYFNDNSQKNNHYLQVNDNKNIKNTRSKSLHFDEKDLDFTTDRTADNHQENASEIIKFNINNPIFRIKQWNDGMVFDQGKIHLKGLFTLKLEKQGIVNYELDIRSEIITHFKYKRVLKIILTDSLNYIFIFKNPKSRVDFCKEFYLLKEKTLRKKNSDESEDAF